MRCGRKCLADYQQTTAECVKDRADMARFESAARPRQGDVQGGPVTWDPRSDLTLCSWSRYYYRPHVTAVCQAGYNQLRQSANSDQ